MPTPRLLLVLAVLTLVAPALAVPKEDKPAATKAAGTAETKDKAGAKPELDERMAAFEKYAQLAELHQRLARLAGTWKTTGKFWLKPGGEPQASTGTMRSSLILGGRFLKHEFEGDDKDHPFFGFGLDGYNTLSQRYESLWVDDHSTAMFRMTGSGAPDGKEINWTGEYEDPVTRKKATVRAVTTIAGDDELVYRHFEKAADGKEYLSMELTHRRAKE